MTHGSSTAPRISRLNLNGRNSSIASQIPRTAFRTTAIVVKTNEL